MPAITACLMVSVLLSSMAILSFANQPAKPRAIEARVSDPFSRARNGSRARQRDAFFRGKRMPDSSHDHVGVRRERFIHCIHVFGRPHHDRQIGQVVRQAVQQLRAVMDSKIEDHAGMTPREFSQ